MLKKKRVLELIIILSCFSLLNGCATGIRNYTKKDLFPKMYEEKPLTILILPPMNESTAADAKEFYATTIQEPISFFGYYTLPYVITSEIFKMEGIYDSELLYNQSLSKFHEFFGADAVLFTTIRKWDKNYYVLAANLIISIDCELKSTKTSDTLWKYNGTIVIDLSGNSGGGIAGLIVDAIETAVKTAATDYVPHAKTANYMALKSIPYGYYHPLANQDMLQEIIGQ